MNKFTLLQEKTNVEAIDSEQKNEPNRKNIISPSVNLQNASAIFSAFLVLISLVAVLCVNSLDKKFDELSNTAVEQTEKLDKILLDYQTFSNSLQISTSSSGSSKSNRQIVKDQNEGKLPSEDLSPPTSFQIEKLQPASMNVESTIPKNLLTKGN